MSILNNLNAKIIPTIDMDSFKTQFNAVVLSVPLSSLPLVTESFNQWKNDNASFVIGVMLCIGIDHALGSWVHWKIKKDFSWSENAKGLLKKSFLCAMSIVIFGVIGDSVKQTSLVYEYLSTITKLIVTLYPALSAMVNMSLISGGKYPPKKLIDKFTGFKDDLNLTNLKENENEVH